MFNPDFTRYLASKKTVDDRALNRTVFQALASRLPSAAPLRVLEVGAGIGTMIERILEWGLISDAEYTALDAQFENIACARKRLPDWAARAGFRVETTGPGRWIFERAGQRIDLALEAGDLFEFAARERGRRPWDLLIAHAFLDLMDIPATLPVLFDLLRPGGLFYFSLNFDGATILEPAVDPELDETIQRLYHRTMDERRTDGRPSGDSRAGRRLFTHLRAAGAQILEAGASDWVVFPNPDGYRADEAYFLRFIVHTIQAALTGHPELEPVRLSAWANERRAQIERGELVYIAHQLDFFGTWLPGSWNPA